MSTRSVFYMFIRVEDFLMKLIRNSLSLSMDYSPNILHIASRIISTYPPPAQVHSHTPPPLSYISFTTSSRIYLNITTSILFQVSHIHYCGVAYCRLNADMHLGDNIKHNMNDITNELKNRHGLSAL